MKKSKIPRVEDGYLTELFIKVGSLEWKLWLKSPSNVSFRFILSNGLDAVTVRKSKDKYWNAYVKKDGKTKAKYVGKSEDVTLGKLKEVAESMFEPEAKDNALLNEFYSRQRNKQNL